MKIMINTEKTPLRIRKEPTERSTIVGHADKGEIFETDEIKNGWYKIADGWVCGNFCKIVSRETEDQFFEKWVLGFSKDEIKTMINYLKKLIGEE